MPLRVERRAHHVPFGEQRADDMGADVARRSEYKCPRHPQREKDGRLCNVQC